MSSLSEKLKSLGVQLGAEGLQPADKKSGGQNTLVDILGGRWESTSKGETFVIHHSYPIGEKFGSEQIRPAAYLQNLSFQFPDIDISSIESNQFTYIDTETTGLSGGTGTYTFLVGAGKFENDRFHLAQFFMNDPSSEPAQLAALESFLASTKVLVSYNGKSFDLPRLRTRYKLHGWPAPLSGLAHLDLLHLVRRIWSNYLPTCSLGDAEHYLLNLKRSDLDIPGWKVADTFFDYLATGNPLPLKQVLYHNEIDVISLAVLLNYLTRRIQNVIEEKYHPADDLVYLSSFISETISSEHGKPALEHAVNIENTPDDAVLIGQTTLAALYKKGRQIDQALPLWKSAADRGDLASHIELAKAYEHHFRSYQEAVHWTLSGLELATRPADHEALRYRLERLKKKVQQHQERQEGSR